MSNLFKKKKQESYGSINAEQYVPASLPSNVEDGHMDLAGFTIGNYSLLDDRYINAIFKGLDDNMKPVIELGDEYTPGVSGDAFIKAQIAVIKNKFKEEVAFHERSGANIKRERDVRIEELDRRITALEKAKTELNDKINSLKDKRAKYAIRFGDHILQLGLPVTVVSLVIDAFINTAFVEDILYSAMMMLVILVFALCLMSDGSMFAFGTLLSQDHKDTPKWLLYGFSALFLTFFVVSIAGSVAIRMGSMAMTYGTYDAAGNFVGKDTFTVAEYALAFISSLCTAATGLFSFFLSYDKDYYSEKECMQLRSQLKKTEKECSVLMNELASLKKAVDPLECDRECRQAAEKVLEALPDLLLCHKRKLMAIRQQKAAYAEGMSESAEELTGSSEGGKSDAGDALALEEETEFTLRRKKEEKDLKEAK